MTDRIFISNAIESEKLQYTSSEMHLGRAHYSWKIIAKLYSIGFNAAGIQAIPVIRPEIYQTSIARDIFGVKDNDYHIAVKPIEHIRPFYGMKNIFIAGWEFPEFSETAYSGNPLNNHIMILKKADQIWCWSDFTRNNLLAYGIKNAITMPPPVIYDKTIDEKEINQISCLPLNTKRAAVHTDLISLGNALEQFNGCKIFLAMLNPCDYRKQINTMITAFETALESNKNIALIVKLIIDNTVTTLGNIQEILAGNHGIDAQTNNIIFLSENLTDGQMIKLTRLADFYLCTSSTEGLNLPLIEVMHQGVVPISSQVTAMADYINKDNAIIIEHDQVPTEGTYHALHGKLETTHFPPKLSSLINSIVYAANMPDDKYKKLSSNAKIEIENKYSTAAFIKRLHTIGF